MEYDEYAIILNVLKLLHVTYKHLCVTGVRQLLEHWEWHIEL